MKGFLKNHKINPNDVALRLEFSDDLIGYAQLTNWQNYLPYSHRVVKIILLKTNNIFLFVGHTNDDETIIYNPGFSKLLLKSKPEIIVKQLDNDKPEIKKKASPKKSKIDRMDILLDKITRFGISSLTVDERRELDYLSTNNN